MKSFFLFLILSLCCLDVNGQDSIHVSDFLKDEYIVFPYSKNINEDYSYDFITFPYIQKEDGTVVPNEKYDPASDTIDERDKMEPTHYNSFWYIKDEFNFNENTPPILDFLPDGKYIQYFSPLPMENGDTLKFFRKQVASIFYIKNNQVNGPSYWFKIFDQTVYKSGEYLNGRREGKWKMSKLNYAFEYESDKNNEFKSESIYTPVWYTIECDFKDGLKDGLQTKTNRIAYKDTLEQKEEIQFKNGRENGTYCFSENNIPLRIGSYKNGFEVGEWFVYDWGKTKEPLELRLKIINNPGRYYEKIYRGNTKLTAYTLENRVLIEHYTINENKTPGKSVIIRGYKAKELNEDNYYHPKLDDQLMNSTPLPYTNDYDQYFSIKSFTEKELEYRNRQDMIDSFYYVFDYTTFEKYYYNGQLETKFKLKDGSLIREDTIFNENGKIASFVVFDTISRLYELYRRSFYNKSKLIKICSFDEQGNEYHPEDTTQILFDSILIGNYYYTDSWIGYLYENRDYVPLHLVAKDSNYLIYDVRLKKGKSFVPMKQLSYNPNTRTTTYFDRLNSENEFMNPRHNYTSKKITSYNSMQFDSLFKSYQRKSEFSIKKLTFYHTSQNLIESQFQADIDSFKTINRYSELFSPLFLESDEVAATLISLKGKAFTGTITFSAKYHPSVKLRKITSHRIKVLLPYSHKSTSKNTFPELLKLFSRSGFYSTNDTNTLHLSYTYDPKKITIRLENGKLNGITKIQDKRNQTIVSIPCKNGQIDGQIESYSTFLDVKKYHKNHTSYRKKFYRNKVENYSDGKRNGVFFQINEPNDTILYCTYVNDLLDGYYYRKDDKKITRQFFQNGVGVGSTKVYDKNQILREEYNLRGDFNLDGKSYLYDTKGRLVIAANFKNDTLTDSTFIYNEMGEITKILIYKDAIFFKELIYDNLVLKSEFTNDTSKYKYLFPLDIPYCSNDFIRKYHPYKEYYGRSDLFEYYDKKIGTIKYFDSDGIVKKEGPIDATTKKDNWYYNYDLPSGKYTIFYKDSIIQLNDTLTFKTLGQFTQQDENGTCLSKRYLLNEDLLYNCGAGETYEINLYYVIYEKDSSMHLVNGWITNYYPTGLKQSEGQNKNGLPTGLWKFYNDNGSLREMGHFINGKKTGRWLSGDLSKIHYMGDMCIEIDNTRMQLFVEDLESKLIINEAIFVKGEKISRNSIVLSK